MAFTHPKEPSSLLYPQLPLQDLIQHLQTSFAVCGISDLSLAQCQSFHQLTFSLNT